MKTVLFVILTAAITNNYVLVKFLGICPFLGVSKKLDQATGMSIAVIFVEVLATAVTWPIYHLLLAGKVDFTYMETVVFILVIAALVQLVEIVLKRYIPALPYPRPRRLYNCPAGQCRYTAHVFPALPRRRKD